MGIAGLGALAGGFNRTLMQGEQLLEMRDARADRQERRARQKTLDERADVQWGRQQKQLDRADDEQAALDEANAAGVEVLKRYEAEWKKQQPGPTLDGSPVAVNPFKPTPMQILEAGSARTNKLLERKGPTQAWMDSFTRDEQMRNQVRVSAAQRVREAIGMGGDLTEPLQAFFATKADAGKVSRAGVSRGPDGKPVVSIQVDGQPQPMVVPAEQFLMEMDRAVANPADLIKHNLNLALKTYEAMLQRGTNQQKHGLTLEEIAARGDEERKTVKVREAEERKRPYTLGEGQERLVDVPQTDGSLKPTRIAANPKDGAGAKATTAKQLNDMVIANYGVLDVGTGRQTGSAKTQALAAAAERLLADNEGRIGPNEAIIQAAKDLGLQLVPKK